MTGFARSKKAIAYKAINLVDGLSKSTRRVAGGLIDHFNPKTGQCDPGVDRMATMLDMNRATAMRATDELDKAGLILKDSHSGKSHRTSYQPQWDRFEEIVADWDRRMKTGAPPGKVAELRLSRSQDCDVNGRNSATQTLLRNPLKETLEDVEGRASNATVVPPGKAARHRKGSQPTGQSYWIHAVAGGKAIRPRDAQRNAAERRWSTALRKHFDGDWAGYARAIEIITDDIADAATDTEMRRKGDGLASILDALQDEEAA